jgi:hypothetical protein
MENKEITFEEWKKNQVALETFFESPLTTTMCRCIYVDYSKNIVTCEFYINNNPFTGIGFVKKNHISCNSGSTSQLKQSMVITQYDLIVNLFYLPVFMKNKT